MILLMMVIINSMTIDLFVYAGFMIDNVVKLLLSMDLAIVNSIIALNISRILKANVRDIFTIN